jgi:hypothetical protein
VNREERLRKFIELLRSDAACGGGGTVVRGWVVRRLEQILDETPSVTVPEVLIGELRDMTARWRAHSGRTQVPTQMGEGYARAAGELGAYLDKYDLATADRSPGWTARRIPNPNYDPMRPPGIGLSVAKGAAAPRTARDFGALIAADAEYPDVILPGGRRVPIKPGAHLRVWVEGGKLHHEVTEELE